jgi:hypothetical protein
MEKYGLSELWVIGVSTVERYGFFINFPANQLGKIKKVWVKYGKIWVIRAMGYRSFNCTRISSIISIGYGPRILRLYLTAYPLSPTVKCLPL